MVGLNNTVAGVASGDGETVRVLLVQQDQLSTKHIHAFLTEDLSRPIVLDYALDVASALLLMANTDYHAIILDMDLPDCRNLEGVRRVLAHALDTSVILLTDTQDDKVIQEALRLGAQDHLEKSGLSGLQLQSAVYQAFARREFTSSENAYDFARRLLQCSNNSILAISPENQGVETVETVWRVIVANLNSRRLLTQSTRDLEGQYLHHFLSEPLYGILDEMLSQILKQGEVRGAQFKCPQQGKWLQFDGVRTALGVVVIITDITAIKGREEELIAARAAAQKILDEKTTILAAMYDKLPGALNRVIGRLDAAAGYDGRRVSGKTAQTNLSGARAELATLLSDVQGLVSKGPSAGFAYMGTNYFTVLEMSPDLSAVVSADDGKIQFMNRVGRDILGYTDTEAMDKLAFHDFVPEDYAVLFEDNMSALRAESARVPMHLIRKDRRLVDVELQVMACPAANLEEWQGRDMVLISAVDTTRRNRASRRIIAREEQLRKIMDNVADAIVVVDENGSIETLNRSTETMFGGSARDLVGKSVGRLLVGGEGTLPSRQLDIFLQGGSPSRISGWRRQTAVKNNGDEFPIEIAVRDLNLGERHLYIGLIRDISERVAYEENILYMATHDLLTTLSNRANFHEDLRKALEKAIKTEGRFGLMFFDLDSFKSINNSYGHLVGDRVLSVFAKRLMQCLDKRARIVARLSADEFVALIEETNGAEELKTLALNVSHAIQTPVIINHHDIRVTCCIGIAEYPSAGNNSEALIRSAEYAVRTAKSLGRASIQVYDETLSSKFIRRQRLETAMATALETDQFTLYYQPKISLASREIVGAEALIRWNHPEFGLVSPAEFIPIAEETGFIRELGNWVLGRVCKNLRDWRENGDRVVPIAVNLSAVQFRDANLVDHLRETLERNQVVPELIEVELTESALVEDVDQAVDTLRKLSNIGLTIAIDDFGSGYSSFGYLTRFPIDCLKIDQAFVSNIPFNQDDMTVARAIIGMAKS